MAAGRPVVTGAGLCGRQPWSIRVRRAA